MLERPVILDDPVARLLVDDEARRTLDADPGVFQVPALRRLRASIVVRGRYAEDALADAVARGVRQYVLLGAGLDSFAYRSPLVGTGLRVFEVDHPDTQRRKRERLREAGIDVPDAVVFVPVDFERETFVDALGGAGFACDEPAFVSWLGVTLYLERSAVVGTLAAAARLAPGSEIVFEYVLPAAAIPPMQRAGMAALAARAANAGEPWRTHFAAGEIAGEMASLGFEIVEHLGRDDTLARYFAGRDDGFAPGGASRLLHARVTVRDDRAA